MFKDFKTYFGEVVKRSIDDEYDYTLDQLNQNKGYLYECWKQSLSAYKALEFMSFEIGHTTDLRSRLKSIGLDFNDVINIYQYGSRVYGTNVQASDFDFIIILKDKPRQQFSDNSIDITFYTIEEFQKRIDDHEISALECLFLPKGKIWKSEHRFKFTLDKQKLRHSLSAKSSNSFVKSMKKLTVEQDYDAVVGKKSLFHAFRIIDFGIQLALYSTIHDYTTMNDIYFDILECDDNWEVLSNEYKTKYNSLMSQFRLVAPK